MTKKVIWLVNQYASTPETGMGGRHYYLARALEQLDYRVYLVAASYTHLLRAPPSCSGRFTAEKREGVNIVWVRVCRYAHAHSKTRVFNWFLFSWRILQLKKVIPDWPDVILYSSPDLVGYLGAERLARRLQVKLVFEVRDIWPRTLVELGGYAPKRPFIRFLQWIEDRAYRNSDVVISNLKYAWQHMVEHGLDKRKFHWVPNGISLDEVANPMPLGAELAIQIPNGTFLVGYIGTLGLANCMETLIGAAELLRAQSQFQFLLVGDGREKSTLESIVRRKSLHNVRFVPSIPKRQIQSLLARFDLCYLGVRKRELYKYGISLNKLFDYMYSGKPILYAIDSGDYHPVASVRAGLEIPPEDPRALADAILKMYHLSNEERIAMGERGRQEVVNHYSYDKLAMALAVALRV